MLAVVSLWCASTADVSAVENDVKKLNGKWAVTVDNAPYGYENFEVTIKEKEKTYLADVNGSELRLRDQKFTEIDGKLQANMYVGEYVTVTIWEEKGVVKGAAATSMGVLDLKFKKLAEKK